MSKFDTGHHINLEIEENDIDSITVNRNATYPEIKEYVFNKFGLKVSSLYIAQVKRKMGLSVRENFNLSKKDNSEQKVLLCPPEKEEAILDALHWFGMLSEF
ncbi:TPA: RNA methyltransferase [Streptococcus suis]|nr:RNA methyltransferase [Streptococcus suis]NQH33966.1 RNA methyltransferase [Streptococcus suis]NQP20303.1 RNA methyltransferase [Streptococcus suis]NQP64927.1 RNA methyltransferase [Streptococcus suis]